MASSAFETTRPDQIAYLDRLAGTYLGRSYKRRMLEELDVAFAPGRRFWTSAAARGRTA